MKRLPEHVQVDDPAAQRKLAKKLERQQVGGGLGDRLHTGAAVLQRAWGGTWWDQGLLSEGQRGTLRALSKCWVCLVALE